MRSLYCPKCNNYLMGSDGECHDCQCGWTQQPPQPLEDDVSDELEYLRFFYSNADFGPTHEDVVELINQQYRNETGNQVPKDY